MALMAAIVTLPVMKLIGLSDFVRSLVSLGMMRTQNPGAAESEFSMQALSRCSDFLTSSPADNEAVCKSIA